MAELAKLEIVIGADAQKAIKGFDQLGAAVKKSEVQVQKFGNTVKKSGADASASLFSLSQVARDLPFGFIAIQNNLPQVVDSFGALAKASGGVGNAFKALAGSLVGPAGIGFAFSIITSAATSLIQKYGSLAAGVDSLFGPWGREAKRVADVHSQLAKAISESAASAAGEILQLKNLTSALADNARPQEERKNAYIALKKEYPGIIQDMTFENALTEAGSKLIASRTEEVKKYILLKGKEAALIKLIEKATLEQLQKEQLLNKNRDKIPTGIADFFSPFAFANAAGVGKLGVEIDDAKKSATDFANELTKVGDEILKLDAKVVGIDPFKGTVEKLDRSAQQIIQAQIRVLEANLKLEEVGVLERFKIRGRIIDLQEKLDQIEAKQTIKNRRALNATLNAIDKEAQAKRNTNTIERVTIKQDDQLSGTLKGTEEQFERFRKLMGVPILIDIKVPDLKAPFTKAELEAIEFKAFMEKLMMDLNTSVANILESGIVDTFGGIGEAIADALTGGGLGGINKVFQAIGNTLTQLGKYAIQTGIKILAFKKALNLAVSNPALLIAAGVALSALGGVIKNKFQSGGIQGFAEGGIVTKPTLAMIGEAGEKEAVIPLSKLEKMMGGGMGGGRLVAEISGDSLRMILDRTDRRQARNF